MNVLIRFTSRARGAAAVRCILTPDRERPRLRRRTIEFVDDDSEIDATEYRDYRQHVRTVEALTVEERLAYYRRFMAWSAVKPTAHDLLFLVIDVLENADHFAELDLLDDQDTAAVVRHLRVIYRATFRQQKQRRRPCVRARRERPSERAHAFVRAVLAEGPHTRHEIVGLAKGIAGRDTLYKALADVAEYDRPTKRWRLKIAA